MTACASFDGLRRRGNLCGISQMPFFLVLSLAKDIPAVLQPTAIGEH
jgi:hypothetical protein